MKKPTLILIVCLMPFLAGYSQDSYIKNRWNFKFGYAEYNLAYFSNTRTRAVTNYRVEANYGILEFLEVGGYLGWSRVSAYLPVVGPPNYVNLDSPFFGVNINFHPLTFLIKKTDFRFDLYLLARYGGVYFSSPEGYYPWRGFQFQYHHGAGLAYYLNKHLGIFGEYSFGTLAKANGSLRLGLTLKFH